MALAHLLGQEDLSLQLPRRVDHPTVNTQILEGSDVGRVHKVGEEEGRDVGRVHKTGEQVG